ncbi:MAG: transposase [Methylocella sp.]
MLTKMTGAEGAIAREAFRAARARRGDPGRDGRRVLEALRYFAAHTIAWRALPAEFGNWTSAGKRFSRVSRSGAFAAFFAAFAALRGAARLARMFDSTLGRAPVSAAAAKGGKKVKRSGARAAASRPKSPSRQISALIRSASI